MKGKNSAVKKSYTALSSPFQAIAYATKIVAVHLDSYESFMEQVSTKNAVKWGVHFVHYGYMGLYCPIIQPHVTIASLRAPHKDAFLEKTSLD